MEKATISEIRNKFSAYLKKVREGEVIIIFDRNKPVARLEGMSSCAEVDQRLARLESTGLISRATEEIPFALLKSMPPKSDESVLDALLEERRESR